MFAKSRHVAACACLLTFAPLALASCVAQHFNQVAKTAATEQLRCPTAAVVPEGEDWAFRADGCGQVAYYRCWYKRKTIPRVQCCAPVPSREDATSFVRWGGPPKNTVCVDISDGSRTEP